MTNAGIADGWRPGRRACAASLFRNPAAHPLFFDYLASMSLIHELLPTLRRNTRFLTAFVALPTLAALVTSLLIPREYLSKASVLPANSRFSDKSRYTAEEITELYSVFSSGDDLDRLYATARSWPVMTRIIDSFGLVQHYRIKKDDERGRENALRMFRKNCGIFKTEYGEMHIKVWDRDRKLAADIANAMVAQTEKAHQDMYRDYYATSLRKLELAYAQLQASEAGVSGPDSAGARRDPPAHQLDYYRRAMTDLRMALLNPPPALVVLEKAIPSVKADRPNIVVNVVATFLISLFTGLAIVLLLPVFIKKG
ncbi:MAG: hypothetical protein EBZ67_06650 [Chitinophagia bacterium]|nr:hypothetical protein [Chitinophagia bacterium]